MLGDEYLLRGPVAVGWLPVHRWRAAALGRIGQAFPVRGPDWVLLVAALVGNARERAAWNIEDMNVVVGLCQAQGDAMAIRRHVHLTQVVRHHIGQGLRTAIHVHHHEAGLGYLVADEGLPAAHGQSYVLPGGAFFELDERGITRVSNYYNLPDWIAHRAAA